MPSTHFVDVRPHTAHRDGDDLGSDATVGSSWAAYNMSHRAQTEELRLALRLFWLC